MSLGNLIAMQVTIDKLGRIVVPKPVRERLGLAPGARLDLEEDNGEMRLRPAAVPARLEERDGVLVVVHDVGARLDEDSVLRLRDEIRQERLDRVWPDSG